MIIIVRSFRSMDEDVDPLVGPMADLMAEHQLATNVKEIPKSIEPIEQKKSLRDYLPVINIHLVFQNVFTYLLDLYWYHYLHQYSPNIEQDTSLHQPTVFSLLKKLTLLCIVRSFSIQFSLHSSIIQVYIILTFPFSVFIHLLSGVYICYLLVIDLLLPLLLYFNWFRCLHSLRRLIKTVEIHQQWLIHIHGFQLIRPTSSLFESQLQQLRRAIFEELRTHFLFTRQIAREYSSNNDQLICSIDLQEFGPLIQSQDNELELISNHFDQISVNSMFKLCHLQINECIQLIHLSRPKSYWIFHQYRMTLSQSIDKLNLLKRNCSMMVNYLDGEKPSSKKLTSTYFLLRSNCEELFQMNENDSINPEQFKRIIQDLKTVLYSLEAIQSKPNPTINTNTSEQILSSENPPSNISSYHRFDDQLAESMDEILVCDTGQLTDEITDQSHETYDYDQRFLREQTHCLMKELQSAIEGKKQEWNEREQRLLGHIEKEIILVEKKSPSVDEQPFQRMSSMENSTSMLDELKHSFALNRNKLHVDEEDIFGEDDDYQENSDDD